MQQKLGILFFGRLDDEKGFGLILDVLNLFIKNYGGIPFSFYVFGKGKYEKELLDMGQKYNSIHFFGWQPLDVIKKYRENCHFCLMPSLCLETFGLSALNSLSMGIPVIGFAKGGLKQFIPDKYDISIFEGQDNIDKLYNKLQEIIRLYNEGKLDIQKESQKAFDLAKNYTQERRFENIKPIIGKEKKILLVSDFKSKIGGIETYIHDVADFLNKEGYEVKIFGMDVGSGKFGKYMRYLGMIFAMRNLVDAIRLKREIRKFMPKIVWYHSTLRWIGWYPIKKIKSENIKKIVMYHDLGYFYPYPSKLVDESDILTPLNLKNFIKSAKTKNPIKVLGIIYKYILVSNIKKQLKDSVDFHLVPSDFLGEIVSKSFQIDKKKIETVPHFIQNGG